ncbi:Clp amino terminal domain [Rubrobacter radiotolerans]|uniref:Clp amino terminal domain n=1 Tax=Rubrobacter radiotolerans TaxID=42256 RepID=A0A023WYT1_RUBRA|nr:Clp protease N-terminal domain-containing protein [Rubrobacter radiotolerans]AHY45387.1 Clp amino terminal domain [Rubrobacter radiotolerans]MDX5892798.1 Clp protease N-terminal domain-containing protein [Rubrobacter radiotolerans]SMC02517.1 ATP-dependent Clp protease ATP-binding subunit ClpC [Rubrobacter radiotolerans DSM 5868]
MIAEIIGRLTRRFTGSARRAVVASMDEAHSRGRDSVGDEDLLLGVLASDRGVYRIAEDLGFGAVDVREELERMFADSLRTIGIDYEEVKQGAGGSVRFSGAGNRRIAFSPLAKRALEESLEVALELRENEIRAEHVLLGALRLRNGRAARALENLGVDIEELKRRLEAREG